MPERRQCHQPPGTLTLVPKLAFSPHRGSPPAPLRKPDQCWFKLRGKWWRASSSRGLSTVTANVCGGSTGATLSAAAFSPPSNGPARAPIDAHTSQGRPLGLQAKQSAQLARGRFGIQNEVRWPPEKSPPVHPQGHRQECCREPRGQRAGCPSGIFHPSHKALSLPLCSHSSLASPPTQAPAAS